MIEAKVTQRDGKKVLVYAEDWPDLGRKIDKIGNVQQVQGREIKPSEIRQGKGCSL